MKTTRSLRVGYMGTPDFALSALKAIHGAGHDVVCVYSQPPRPKGRGHKVQPSPVHEFADEAGIPVFNPLSFKDEAAITAFAAQDLDIAIVAAYGLILPQAVLDAPRLGCVNIHASLLPRWRGASPIQHAIWHGDAQSGVCLMQMEAGLDTGPVIMREAMDLPSDINALVLHDDLAAMGARMVVDLLDQLVGAQEPLSATVQDDALSNYAPLLAKQDGKIDWAQDALAIERQVRALNPWPGVWCMDDSGKRIKVHEAHAADLSIEKINSKPAYLLKKSIGEIVNADGFVLCDDDSVLQITRIQPEGKKLE